MKELGRAGRLIGCGCLTTLLMLMVSFALPAIYCKITQWSPIQDAPTTQVVVLNDRMIVQGNINERLAHEVHRILSLPHAKINIVRVSSAGGEENAARTISADLDNLGPHAVIVPTGFTCQSACIKLGLGSNTEFRPDDGATLMFHRKWLRVGSNTCSACRLVAWEANYLKDAVLGSDWHREMFWWAEGLKPGLGQAIAQCKPNPFDTIGGITISGKQFTEFHQGSPGTLTCPSGN